MSKLRDDIDDKLTQLGQEEECYDFSNQCDDEVQWANERIGLLSALTIPDNIEDLTLVKTRFDGLDRDVAKRAPQLSILEEKRKQFPPCKSDAIEADADTVFAPAIMDSSLNSAVAQWKELSDVVTAKKEEFTHAEKIQKFLLDGSETKTWIGEKAEIIDATRDYGDSLSGVLALQRKLAIMERDVNAIKSKIDDLNSQASKLLEQYPEDETKIKEMLESIDESFLKLENLLKLREEKLGQAGNLQTFMRDLAEFQVLQ